MRKFLRNSLFIISIVFLSKITCLPCPNECICKSTQLDIDYKQIWYTIDCTNAYLPLNKLVYQAPSWSISQDQFTDDPYDLEKNQYIISIILSNINSLTNFNNQTIELTGFSSTIQSLSITQQSNEFRLQINSFNSNLYQNLKFLNLSYCCRQIPPQCSTLFQSLKQLEILDLSGSNLYSTCLNTPDPISPKLRDLILRDNQYNSTAFSHSSQLFTGVRHITGKLDLQKSFFNFSLNVNGNCLFDQFTQIQILDLSAIQFPFSTNRTDIYLKHLLFCKTHSNTNRNGQQLIELYLREMNLRYLPTWFTTERFPLLNLLDLSSNQIYSIDLQLFSSLKSISLANNPIEFDNIQWYSNENIYQSINLRSTVTNRLFNLTEQLQNLFKLSSTIDFSENFNENDNYLSNINVKDFNDISLNLSRTNIYLFDIKDLSNFDNLYSLDISDNYLKELNLEKQMKLIYLDCSNQQLERVVLYSDLSSLIQLKCSNNSLKSIENLRVNNQRNLQLIDLSYNQIQTLEDHFSDLKNRYLRTINLKSNSIQQIHTNQFNDQLFSLYSIDLSYNQINFIEKSAFQSPNLQILDLTNNPLKIVEGNFLLSPSLRLFYLINSTQQLIERCAQLKSIDSLLSTYLTWFEQNSTYMKTIDKEKCQQIQFDKCLTQYRSRGKTKWTKFNEKLSLQHLSWYIPMCAIGIGLILGVIYVYKKKQCHISRYFQRYRPLDTNYLIDNAEELGEQMREDDKIVINLCESPFHAHDRS